MLERDYQHHIIKTLERRFPGCIVLKLDTGFRQGVPDLVFFHWVFWATLEVKRSRYEATQANQPWYVEKMDEMSFSAFIFPENEEEVLDALERSYRASRNTRPS